MTHGSDPTDSQSPDSLGADSERRRWVHKRAQFDSAINSARLLGVVQNLSSGAMQASDALHIILDVNSSNDQARYVAEMLAMKKEFRDLTRLEYQPEIAKFIIEGARLVPNLTGGLSSQMLMAMGHAAQNDAYIETVSTAVSALLADLDNPLMPDARNYLRLLWDQMEATRRLKQTEAMYTGQRPSLAPDRARGPERGSSGAMPKASPARAIEASKPVSAPVITAAPSVDHSAKSATRTMMGLGQSPSVPAPEAAGADSIGRKLWREAEEDQRVYPAAAVSSSEESQPKRDSGRHPTPRADSSVPASRGKREIRWKVAEDSEPIQSHEASSQVSPRPAVATPPVHPPRDSTSKLVAQPERVARDSAWKVAPESEEGSRDSVSRLTEPSILGVPAEPKGQRAAEAPSGSASKLELETALDDHEQQFFASGEDEPDEPTTQMDTSVAAQVQTPNRSTTDMPADSHRLGARESGRAYVRQTDSKREEFKLPTRNVPKWAVASVVAVALAGAGLVVALTSEPKGDSDAAPPKPSGANAATSAAGEGSSATTSNTRPKRTSGHPSAAGAPPPPPPAPTEPESLPLQPQVTHRATQKAQGPASSPLQQNKPQTVAPVSPVAPRNAAPSSVAPAPTPKNTTPAAGPTPKAVTVVTPPEVAKTLSPVDRIVAELRLISPDPAGIEDKARELARIIARSKRKEASRIIEDLSPSVAIDPISHDATFEDSLQNFAISVLGRVATDDDDNRAVDALLLLGEWVKNGGKSKQKALSALQTLSHESIVKTSAPRLRALKTAQAQAD